jgi:hypothetical protein
VGKGKGKGYGCGEGGGRCELLPGGVVEGEEVRLVINVFHSLGESAAARIAPNKNPKRVPVKKWGCKRNGKWEGKGKDTGYQEVR